MSTLMHPPATGAMSATVNGRTYTATPGNPAAVPDFDVTALESNGWIRADFTGTTAQRPVLKAVDKGYKFHDTTVGAQILWDGKAWRHATTGAAV